MNWLLKAALKTWDDLQANSLCIRYVVGLSAGPINKVTRVPGSLYVVSSAFDDLVFGTHGNGEPGRAYAKHGGKIFCFLFDRSDDAVRGDRISYSL